MPRRFENQWTLGCQGCQGCQGCRVHRVRWVQILKRAQALTQRPALDPGYRLLVIPDLPILSEGILVSPPILMRCRSLGIKLS